MRLRFLAFILCFVVNACGSEAPTTAPVPTPTAASPVPDPAPVPTPSPTPSPSSSAACAADADCVYSDVTVCPVCCNCPRVMSASEQRETQQAAAVSDCAAVDCTHVRCGLCATRPARIVCEAGACIGKNDGTPTPPHADS